MCVKKIIIQNAPKEIQQGIGMIKSLLSTIGVSFNGDLQRQLQGWIEKKKVEIQQAAIGLGLFQNSENVQSEFDADMEALIDNMQIVIAELQAGNTDQLELTWGQLIQDLQESIQENAEDPQAQQARLYLKQLEEGRQMQFESPQALGMYLQEITSCIQALVQPKQSQELDAILAQMDRLAVSELGLIAGMSGLGL